jgi:hypothetical protein
MNPCIHSFQNLLGGLTQVQRFILQILCRDSVRPGAQKEESSIEVANGVQAEVEAVGDVSLELVDGFILLLRDVFLCSFIKQKLD